MSKEWKYLKFEDCLDKFPSYSKIAKNKFLTEGEYPIISQEKDYINGYWNEENDVIKIAKPVVIFGDHTKVVKLIDFDFVAGADGVKIFQPIKDITAEYLAYFLQNLKLDDLGYARHYRLLKQENVPIPPLPVQQQIVEKLDAAFEAIDRARANIEKNIQNAKELFQSKLNEVFSQDDKIEKKWSYKKLSEIFDVRDGTHDSPKYVADGFPLITSKNLKNGKLTFEKVNFIKEEDFLNINKRSKVDINDIVFAMIGTIGNPVVIIEEPKFAIKNVALIKANSNNNSNFYRYYLDSSKVIEKMQKESKGATQKFVSLGYMRNFVVPNPNLQIQQKIVNELDQLSAHTESLQQKYTQKLQNLEELRKSILEKAFKGELTN